MTPKYLIYSCCFHQEKYANLIKLLLRSLVLWGDINYLETDFLIITNKELEPSFKAMFKKSPVNVDIFCLNLRTKFEACYSRLYIFNYPTINQYQKILYLDCDILITNRLNLVLDLELENKLYALKAGTTVNPYFGADFFDFDRFPKTPAFTSGILLFNNCTQIKLLFFEILNHIQKHIEEKLPVPICFDQPFIVFHAISKQLYDNKKLIGKVIDNPKNYNGESISHFPGGPGDYKSKIVKMVKYFQFKLNFEEDEVVEKKFFIKVLSPTYPMIKGLNAICSQFIKNKEINLSFEQNKILQAKEQFVSKLSIHMQLASTAKNIIVIGFKTGLASLIYLAAKNNSHITIFDELKEDYTKPCFAYLHSLYPERLQLIIGSPIIMIPKFLQENEAKDFDLISISGSLKPTEKLTDQLLLLASNKIIWENKPQETLINFQDKKTGREASSPYFLEKTLEPNLRVFKKNPLINKRYKWMVDGVHEVGYIYFLLNKLECSIGKANYKISKNRLIAFSINERSYLLKFSVDFLHFISFETVGLSFGKGFKVNLQNKIIAVTSSNKYDTVKMKYLLESTKANGFEVEIIGVGQPFTWINRLRWLKEFLRKYEEDDIIVFTDAYDVFYIDELNIIKEKFLKFNKSIVWSAEKKYSHQIGEEKVFYDSLANGNSNYKYINAGTFMGYKKSLEILIDDIFISIKDDSFVKELADGGANRAFGFFCDQSIIGHHLVKNFDKYDIQLDYNCEIFYVASEDWKNISNYVDNSLNIIATNSSPSIIHVPFRAKWGHVLDSLYNLRFQKRLHYTSGVKR